jgi:hypothetical protein
MKGQGDGSWAQGKGEGNGPGMGGPGQGQGGKAPENPHDVGLTKDRIKSQLGKGVIVGSWFTTGEPPSGKALAEYSDAQRTYSEEAKEALSKQKVPAEYQNYVRDYFDSIRVPEKK